MSAGQAQSLDGSVTEAVEPKRWPSLRAVLGCGVVAAAAVAVDAFFSAQEGYLSRAPDYDGVSYLGTARSVYLLVRSLHLRAALHDLNSSIAPLWTGALAFQQLILGPGTWQAFTARFWAVALLLTLIYWIVRARGPRSLAVAAVFVTALLPVAGAGVRASSWELITGQANYGESWYLDDLRPDFLAAVLVLWSIALLAEDIRLPRRSSYLLSAAFAAAAVLVKPTVAPLSLLAWAAALAVTWAANRRTAGTTRTAALAAIVLAVLLVPWAVFGGGLRTTAQYLYEGAVTFKDAYGTNVGFPGSLAYYLLQIPDQLGHIEGWLVIVGSLLMAVALVRRRLGRSEWMYAGTFVLFFVVLTAPANKNPFVGQSIILALWVFFVAAAARFASFRWPERVRSASPKVLAAVAVYTLIVYAAGAVALAGWPANESRSNAQLLAVTTDVALELGRHVSAGQCFAYAPGPGWPGSLQYVLMDRNGAVPESTATDVAPSSTTVSAYVAAASRCPAVIAYREDITEVARVFFAPPVRQPYLRAVAEWVRTPDSGYALDRTWHFSDLAPSGQHTLGHYQGVSLTVDLYVRIPAP